MNETYDGAGTAIDNSATTIGSSGSSTGWLNGLTSGAGASTRIANKVRLTSLNIRLAVYGASTPYDSLRIMLVRWKYMPPNVGVGSIPPMAAVLQSVSPIFAMQSPYNWTSRGMFEVLYDKVIQVNCQFDLGTPLITPPGFIPYYTPVKRITINRRIGKTTVWSDGASANNITRGGIIMYAISNSASMPHPTLTFYMRFKYQDA